MTAVSLFCFWLANHDAFTCVVIFLFSEALVFSLIPELSKILPGYRLPFFDNVKSFREPMDFNFKAYENQ